MWGQHGWNAAEVFLYTGVGEGAIEIPTDVVCVRIDPSVLVIAEWAFALKFKLRYKLREVSFMTVFAKFATMHSRIAEH